MIRIAAVGDVHYDRHPRHAMRNQFKELSSHADLLLIAGDLTQSGSPDEARALMEDLSHSSVPVVSVLGNHDFHSNQQEQILALLKDGGVTSLEGSSAVFQVGQKSVGVVGMKGFGGGFFGACITEFGEPETKQFARHAKQQAEILKQELQRLQTDLKIVLLHFSPVEDTLLGEKREIYPFLGSYLLAEAIDGCGADVVFHGHAHHGVEKGSTPGGIPVRNVALTVLRHAYKVYTFETTLHPEPSARQHPAVSNPVSLG